MRVGLLAQFFVFILVSVFLFCPLKAALSDTFRVHFGRSYFVFSIVLILVTEEKNNSRSINFWTKSIIFISFPMQKGSTVYPSRK